jgi:hypothetical protein
VVALNRQVRSRDGVRRDMGVRDEDAIARGHMHHGAVTFVTSKRTTSASSQRDCLSPLRWTLAYGPHEQCGRHGRRLIGE